MPVTLHAHVLCTHARAHARVCAHPKDGSQWPPRSNTLLLPAPLSIECVSEYVLRGVARVVAFSRAGRASATRAPWADNDHNDNHITPMPLLAWRDECPGEADHTRVDMDFVCQAGFCSRSLKEPTTHFLGSNTSLRSPWHMHIHANVLPQTYSNKQQATVLYFGVASRKRWRAHGPIPPLHTPIALPPPHAPGRCGIPCPERDCARPSVPTPPPPLPFWTCRTHGDAPRPAAATCVCVLPFLYTQYSTTWVRLLGARPPRPPRRTRCPADARVRRVRRVRPEIKHENKNTARTGVKYLSARTRPVARMLCFWIAIGLFVCVRFFNGCDRRRGETHNGSGAMRRDGIGVGGGP